MPLRIPRETNPCKNKTEYQYAMPSKPRGRKRAESGGRSQIFQTVSLAACWRRFSWPGRGVLKQSAFVPTNLSSLGWAWGDSRLCDSAAM